MNARTPELISVRTAAQRLDVSERFITKAIERGELRSVLVNRMRRIDVREFTAWVESMTKAA